MGDKYCKQQLKILVKENLDLTAENALLRKKAKYEKLIHVKTGHFDVSIPSMILSPAIFLPILLSLMVIALYSLPRLVPIRLRKHYTLEIGPDDSKHPKDKTVDSSSPRSK